MFDYRPAKTCLPLHAWNRPMRKRSGGHEVGWCAMVADQHLTLKSIEPCACVHSSSDATTLASMACHSDRHAAVL